MNIVETAGELEYLLHSLQTTDFFIDVVGTDMDKHPSNNRVCLVLVALIRDIRQFYCVPIEHNEAICFSDSWEKISSSIKKSDRRKFVRGKKNITQYFGADFDFLDLDIVDYLRSGETGYELEPTRSEIFIESFHRDGIDLNKAIPIYSHAKKFVQMVADFEKIPRTIWNDEGFKFLNFTESNSFSELEKIGIAVNREIFLSMYGNEHSKDIKDGRVFSQYNLLTSTGRPSNAFGGINYAAINKTDGSRYSFVSRFGDDGMLVLMDYNAFHPRLIAKLVNFDIPMDKNPNVLMAMEYFNKTEETIDEEDIAVSKILTFQQIYGSIDEKWSHIPYFQKIQQYINHRWKFFVSNGYIETPVFFRRIKECHIESPSPNKLFNYVLQAFETEMAVKTLNELLGALKNKKTKPVLYTYDSILFDAHKEDKMDTIREIKKIMEDAKLPVKVCVGRNLAEMTQVQI